MFGSQLMTVAGNDESERIGTPVTRRFSENLLRYFQNRQPLEPVFS